jgi:SAM-dependent methyltransferase
MRPSIDLLTDSFGGEPVTTLGQETRDTRAYLAQKYLKGSGIEIGALDAPFPRPQDLDVRYVDRFSRAELKLHYPELDSSRIIDPDIIADGEVLGTIPDRSFDFVVASHFLEHCENPLKTIRNHFRVLRPGGRLLLAIPNSAHPESWDFGRQLTTFQHLIMDDRNGPETSRHQHYMEWVTFAGKMTGASAQQECIKLIEMRYSIHFHCWDVATFLPFLFGSLEYNNVTARCIHYEGQDYEILALLEV